MAKKKHKVNEEFWSWWYSQMDRDYERPVALAELRRAHEQAERSDISRSTEPRGDKGSDE